MKLGIIIDSSSGLSEKEAQKNGWGYLPLHIFIDGKDFKDGVEITSEEVCDIININTKTQTSVTSPGEAMQVFDDLKDKYDKIIVLPISSKLSSQFSNLTQISKEYDNIFVYDTKGLSLGIELMAKEALELFEQGKIIEDIFKALDKLREDTMCLVVPKHLDWLVKGGRVNSKIAAMANMLKIIPIIELKDGALEKYGKGRMFDKTIYKSTKTILKELDDKNIEFTLVHSGNEEVREFAQNIEAKFGITATIKRLPSSITMHVGLGAIALFGYIRKKET